VSRFRRRRSESDRHIWLRIDDHEGGRCLATPRTVMNSMAGQEENAYSLDHRSRRYSVLKFNRDRDIPAGGESMSFDPGACSGSWG
jgi:hypothetical protein